MCEVSDFRISTETALCTSNDFRTSREIPLSFLSMQYFFHKMRTKQQKKAFRCVKLAILVSERKLLFRSRVATIATKNIKCKIVVTSVQRNVFTNCSVFFK